MFKKADLIKAIELEQAIGSRDGGGKRVSNYRMKTKTKCKGSGREFVPKEHMPVKLKNGRWLVAGQEITKYTLKWQRLYAQNEFGVWTRPVCGCDNISLPEET